MAKDDEVGQLKQFECTYAGCQKRFDTIKEMKRHKVNEPEHNFCKKCDVDCDDWEALTQHKVDAMTPWLEGSMRHHKEESPNHIVCEWCGMDFKSFGGRKIHIAQEHKADQHIVCQGCYTIFARAGSLIAHLEQGQCNPVSGITKREFHASVQQKHVNAQILEAPEAFMENIRNNKALPPVIQDTEDGGVTLLDQDDEAQKGGYKPLEAEVDLMDLNTPWSRSNTETWPRLPGLAPSELTESIRSMSIGSPAPSTIDAGVSASEFASQIVGNRGSNRVYDKSYPSLSLLAKEASDQDNDDTASQAPTTKASSVNHPMAWATGNTSRTLFEDAKPSPPAGDWNRIIEQRVEQHTADDKTNVLKNRWWDPTSDAYNVDQFLHQVTGMYCCPFVGCGDSYDAASDLEGHLRNAHLKTSYRCPLCLKIFRSASALISHAEANGRCKVQKSEKFDKLLDEVSGGFLKAEHLRQPAVYRPSTALVKAGDRVNGVMPTKFIAKMPDEP